MAQARAVAAARARWWQRAVVYQIYPRSFQDASGDGVGDLLGVRQRLPYLRMLGVDAVWLSPIFLSPMVDFGYDVADYCAVDPLFGTLADIDALVAEMRWLQLRVLLDLVPCHTSDQHAWFKASRASRTSPQRDWYIWRDPAPDGGPPNNWLSHFAGAAWTLDAATGQYYLHSFLREQPDLNWHNPAVERAVHDVMRFWLRRGVDGFRVDVMHGLFKDKLLRDEPVNPRWKKGTRPHDRLLHPHTLNQPETHAAVVRMRRVLEEFEGDRVLIGEIYAPLPELMKYYGKGNDGCHLPFNFHLIGAEWTAERVRTIVDKYEAHLPPEAWPNWCLSNHDQSRMATRVGPAQARVGLLLLFTLRGTPTTYYGDEIGMTDVAIPPERMRDPFELGAPGIGVGRDPERTPMQWSAEANAGFAPAGVEPWLPIAADYAHKNVEAQSREPTSCLAMVRRLLELRRASETLQLGGYRSLAATDPAVDRAVFAFLRTAHEPATEAYAVLLNVSDRPQRVQLRWPELLAAPRTAALVLSTFMDREQHALDLDRPVHLRPNEGVLLHLSTSSML